jgi:hypothetical protein
MEKEFIPYTEALTLKELGFDEPCFRWYDERWGDDLQQDKFNTNKDLFMTDLDCSAPLYSQAFRWFRKKYFKMSYVYYDIEYKFCFCIGYNDKTKGFNTYEEAELECLKKLIEIVKNK